MMLSRGALLVIGALLCACEGKRQDSQASFSSSSAASPRVTGTAQLPASGEARPSLPVVIGSAALPVFDPVNLTPFAPIPEGVDKPAIDEATKLGRSLYFDLRLSAGGDVSCGSCHDPARGGADGEVRSTGTKKQKPKRHTPTVLNAGGSFAQGWDARASTMEEFVLLHVLDATIMGVADEKHLTDAIAAIPAYATAFKTAFPEEKPAITAETFARALGGYVKKLFARSRWDRYLAGEKTAVTDAELGGLAMFVEAGCTSCHQGKYIGAMQSQKLGIAKPWPPPAGTDPGRFETTKQEVDRGMFKVPTLRNVTRTAPYLHDGSVGTLEETVRLMARHQVGRELAEPQVNAIVTFLGALAGEPPKELVAKPQLPGVHPRAPKSD
jgi:cytochrome c peroxidase